MGVFGGLPEDGVMHRWTLIGAFILASAPAVLGHPESSGPKRTLLKDTVTAPLETRGGKLVVRVKINGKGPFPLLLDTGAGATVFNADLAKELGLKKTGTTRIGDPSNPTAIEAEVFDVDRIEIGGCAFEGLQAVAWDRAALYKGKDAPRGVLGFPLFADCLIAIDTPGAKLTLSKGELEPTAKGVIEYRQSHGGIPEIDIDLAGTSVATHIDTGATSGLTVKSELAEELPLKDKPVVVARARTVNSEVEVKAATLDGTVVFAGYGISEPEVSFNTIVQGGNLGMEVLGDYILRFDQHQKLVQFEHSGSASGKPKRRAPGGRPRLGVMMAKSNVSGVMEMTIDKVMEGTPAAKAGLKEGDRLIAIGGKEIASMSDEDFRAALGAGDKLELTIERDGKEMKLPVNMAATPAGKDAKS